MFFSVCSEYLFSRRLDWVSVQASSQVNCKFTKFIKRDSPPYSFSGDGSLKRPILLLEPFAVDQQAADQDLHDDDRIKKELVLLPKKFKFGGFILNEKSGISL